MITLHTFGPAFGLPDGSPFVMKAMLLLKLAGIPYEAKAVNVTKAPKGKLPVLVDDGQLVPDSTFIRLHLEQKYGIDFDAGYDARARGTAWAIEKLLEDHLYWLAVHDRWLIDANFYRGPVHFFDSAPALLRPLITRIVRGKIKRNLFGQGLGRHSDVERGILARRGLDAIASVLGDRPYLLGDKPCGADATVTGFVAATLCPLFPGEMLTAVKNHASLVAYRDRMLAQYFPDWKPAA